MLFLLLFIALEQGAAVRGEGLALELLAEEVGIGFAVGVVLSLIAAKVARFATEADWLAYVWQSMTVPALAILIFAVAQGLHGRGHIAAFVGGLCFRAAMKEDVHEMLLPAEGAGEVRAMTAWVLFAMMLLPAALPHIGWSEVIYAVPSLTIIRVMPVILSLAGTGEPMASKAFVA